MVHYNFKIRKRLFSLITAVSLIAVFSCGATNGVPKVDKVQADEEKPNVLFIMVDDLNDWVGYTGKNGSTITPNIDALAARGTAFTEAYGQYPVCGPSRASLFSGLLPSDLKMWDHPKGDHEVVEAAAKHKTPLLHTYFRENGYKTMAVGKLLHKHLPKGSVDLSGGRGDWDQLPGSKELKWKSKKTLTDWGVYPESEEEMTDPKAAAWAVSRLEEKHDSPFMLMVGFLRPHVPWYVPQKYFDNVGDADQITLPLYKKDDLDDLTPYIRDLNRKEHMPSTEWAIKEGEWHNIVQSYLASINFADHYVGKVLDALKASKYADNTIVILVSDHGYLLGEKNTFQKQALWERANKVPMIIAGPGLPQGEKRQQTVGLIDLYPTMLDLAGLPRNSANVGHSLKPILLNAEQKWNYPVISQWQDRPKAKGKKKYLSGQAIQLGSWRYSLYGDGSEELYNHDVDPHEWSNLASTPALAAKNRQLMDDLKAKLPNNFKPRLIVKKKK
jgi:arylsulfatase A-like enzyme